MEAPDMSVTKARQIVLAARPQGKPRVTDFRLEETAVPTPGPGQVLLHVQYLSLDPYMRERMDDRESYQPPIPLGDVMPGESVATVVASHHPGYSAGDIVLAHTGWRTHALSDRADHRKLDSAVAPVTAPWGCLHRIRRPPRDRQAQAQRNRRRRGRKRAGGIAGRPAS